MPSRPAAGGARRVLVDPERLARWLAGHAERHGTHVATGAGPVLLTAADGCSVEVAVPCPPLSGDLVAHCLRERRLGLLLVRRGGYAAGVALGPVLVASKVGSRHVQGRTAAGGWSQQRFARRREGQAAVATGSAADTAARVLLPDLATLEGVVAGGDRAGVDAVLADPRLAGLRPLVTGRFLDVPDPRLTVLQSAVADARKVPLLLHDSPACRTP